MGSKLNRTGKGQKETRREKTRGDWGGSEKKRPSLFLPYFFPRQFFARAPPSERLEQASSKLLFSINLSGTNRLKNTFEHYDCVGFRGRMAYADVYQVYSSGFDSQLPNAIFSVLFSSFFLLFF